MKAIRYISKSATVTLFMGLLVAAAALGSFVPGALPASASTLAPSSADGGVRYGKLNITVYNALQAGMGGISGASVAVSNTKGEIIASGATDSTGAFSSYVQEGSHKLRVIAPGFAEFSTSIKIVSGQVTTLQVNLTPATPPATALGKLNLTVTSTSVLPIQASVIVFDQTGNTVAKGVTDGTGRFAAALPAGSYKVLVQAAGYDFSTQKVEIAAGALTEAKVVLTRSTPTVTSGR